MIWIFLLTGILIAGEIAYFIYRCRRKSKSDIIINQVKEGANGTVQLALNNPNPMLQITRDGTVLFANPAAYTAFMRRDALDINHPILLGLDAYFSLKSEVTREVTYYDSVYQQTIVWTQTNGEESLIIYCYDITTRQKYETELKRAHKLAEESRRAAEHASEARGEFLANMSHELRTPMNGIIGLSDLLIDAGLQGENHELIVAINNSARNLLILLNDILDFSKIEAGELGIESIPFNIRQIVSHLDFIHKTAASQKGVVMRSHVEESVPEWLRGDPARLQQILNNLISNAIKFTDEGTVAMTIGGTENASDGMFHLVITVDDTGIGIPKDKQAGIFEQFQQADASTSRKYGGTGLGLTITKQLVTLMNGDITLESEMGQGATFTITLSLPVASEAETEALGRKVEDINHADGLNTSARLLVVDDHPINLLFLRKLLTEFGFDKFDEAGSGHEALALYERKAHDLILMDCQMPDMDGYDATRKIRAYEKTPKGLRNRAAVIAVTANAMKGAEEKCLQAGMDDYISKPVDKTKLYQRLQQWLPAKKIARPLQMKMAAPAPLKDDLSESMMASSDSDVFDWNHLNEFTDGDKDVEKQILDVFITHLESDYQEMVKAYENQDFDEWGGWVHKLRGACAHIGAKSMAEACNKAQNTYVDEPGKIPDLHKIVVEEYDVLIKEMKKHILS